MTQKMSPLLWNDKGMATKDISSIEIWIGNLQKEQKMTVIGQFSICYGATLQKHGTCVGVTNLKNFIINFTPGERIKSVKIFRSFQSKFIIGIQFQTNHKKSPIYGQESRFQTELKSPYSSNSYYLKYFHGAADNIIHSINAEFGSTLKSPFCSTGDKIIDKKIDSEITTSGYSTLSSVGSTERSDEENSYSFSSERNRHSLHSVPDRTLHRGDLDGTLEHRASYGTKNRSYLSNQSSFRSTHSDSSMDQPMDVHDLEASRNSETYAFHPPPTHLLNGEQYPKMRRYKTPPVKPQRSYYVGSKQNLPTKEKSAPQMRRLQHPHQINHPVAPAYQKSMTQNSTSLALNRPIYTQKHVLHKPSYNHSHL